jgi:hypothetical protein
VISVSREHILGDFDPMVLAPLTFLAFLAALAPLAAASVLD